MAPYATGQGEAVDYAQPQTADRHNNVLTQLQDALRSLEKIDTTISNLYEERRDIQGMIETYRNELMAACEHADERATSSVPDPPIRSQASPSRH